jgi:hypothetical protein
MQGLEGIFLIILTVVDGFPKAHLLSLLAILDRTLAHALLSYTLGFVGRVLAQLVLGKFLEAVPAVGVDGKQYFGDVFVYIIG